MYCLQWCSTKTTLYSGLLWHHSTVYQCTSGSQFGSCSRPSKPGWHCAFQNTSFSDPCDRATPALSSINIFRIWRTDVLTGGGSCYGVSREPHSRQHFHAVVWGDCPRHLSLWDHIVEMICRRHHRSSDGWTPWRLHSAHQCNASGDPFYQRGGRSGGNSSAGCQDYEEGR